MNRRGLLFMALAAASVGPAFAGPEAESDAARQIEIMTPEKYRDYLARFNARDTRFADHYQPDVWFDHGAQGGMLRGRQAIVSYYERAWTELRENIAAGAIVIDNEHGIMAVELTTVIDATEDVTKTPGMDMKKGDRLILTGMILYGLKDGKISWIRAPEEAYKLIRAGDAPAG